MYREKSREIDFVHSKCPSIRIHLWIQVHFWIGFRISFEKKSSFNCNALVPPRDGGVSVFRNFFLYLPFSHSFFWTKCECFPYFLLCSSCCDFLADLLWKNMKKNAFNWKSQFFVKYMNNKYITILTQMLCEVLCSSKY